MNTEERFYCASCRVPVEYVAEIEAYTCSGCELIQGRDEIITERDLLRADTLKDRPREKPWWVKA